MAGDACLVEDVLDRTFVDKDGNRQRSRSASILIDVIQQNDSDGRSYVPSQAYSFQKSI